MAQSERFYFWRGYYDALKKLPTDEQRGRLVLAICAYAFDGIEPDLDDDPMLDMAWSLVADGTRESVRKGIEQSQRGQMGGRPTNVRKTTVKSGAKTTAKSGAKSSVKSTAESTAESEEKRSETSLLTERSRGVASAADAATLRPSEPTPPNIPPKPKDWR